MLGSGQAPRRPRDPQTLISGLGLCEARNLCALPRRKNRESWSAGRPLGLLLWASVSFAVKRGGQWLPQELVKPVRCGFEKRGRQARGQARAAGLHWPRDCASRRLSPWP